MDLLCWTPFVLFGQGFIDCIDGLQAVFPLLVGFGVKHHEARFAFNRQDHGPVRLFEQAGEFQGLSLRACGPRKLMKITRAR